LPPQTRHWLAVIPTGVGYARAPADQPDALKNNQRKSKKSKLSGKGGKRAGAGRKKGVLNQLTADVIPPQE